MSSVSTQDVTKTNDPTEFIRFASQVISSIQTVVNGKLDFNTNFNSQVVTVDFTTAGGPQRISHMLNKTGVNFLVANKNISCDVFRGTGDTASVVNLICTQKANVTLVLF